MTLELAINKDGVRGSGNAGHDPVDCSLWEVEVDQNVLNEVPTDRVESFLEVNLQGASGRDGVGIIVFHQLLAEMNIVSDGAVLDESSLGITNDARKNKLDSLSQNLVMVL